jgi:hypothetical protein
MRAKRRPGALVTAGPNRKGRIGTPLPSQSPKPDQAHSLSVYAGQRHLGFVRLCANGAEALTPDYVSLGLYATLRAAADALEAVP